MPRRDSALAHSRYMTCVRGRWADNGARRPTSRTISGSLRPSRSLKHRVSSPPSCRARCLSIMRKVVCLSNLEIEHIGMHASSVAPQDSTCLVGARHTTAVVHESATIMERHAAGGHSTMVQRMAAAVSTECFKRASQPGRGGVDESATQRTDSDKAGACRPLRASQILMTAEVSAYVRRRRARLLGFWHFN